MLSIAAADPTASKYMPPASQYIHLPVGMNVKDNPAVPLAFAHPSVDDYDGWNLLWSGPRPADVKQYLSKQAGVLAAPSSRLNFWRKYVGPDGKPRYIQGTARPASSAKPSFPFNTSSDCSISMYVSEGLTSKGRIGINSTMQAVILQKPWLTDPADKDVLVRAIADLLSVAKQIPKLVFLAPENDTSIESFVTSSVRGSNHWIGSTIIGTNSSSSVVDPNTKVWNTNNLFIVDAGIVPGMPMGNPMGALLVSSEMASRKILALNSY
ncbi:hypothetical protein FRC07_013235, partial [Ceratobasidium sp. 392]